MTSFRNHLAPSSPGWALVTSGWVALVNLKRLSADSIFPSTLVGSISQAAWRLFQAPSHPSWMITRAKCNHFTTLVFTAAMYFT